MVWFHDKRGFHLLCRIEKRYKEFWARNHGKTPPFEEKYGKCSVIPVTCKYFINTEHTWWFCAQENLNKRWVKGKRRTLATTEIYQIITHTMALYLWSPVHPVPFPTHSPPRCDWLKRSNDRPLQIFLCRRMHHGSVLGNVCFCAGNSNWEADVAYNARVITSMHVYNTRKHNRRHVAGNCLAPALVKEGTVIKYIQMLDQHWTHQHRALDFSNRVLSQQSACSQSSQIPIRVAK